MALIGPYFRLIFIERIALFIIGPHDGFQYIPVDGIFPAHARQQFVDIGPTMMVQGDAGDPGLMPQNQADIAADARQIGYVLSSPCLSAIHFRPAQGNIGPCPAAFFTFLQVDIAV